MCCLFGGFSTFALLTLNIERFVALTRPFFHQSLALQMIILGALMLLYWFDLEKNLYGPIIASAILLSSLFALTVLNYKMLMIVRSKRDHELRVAPTSSATPAYQERQKKRKKNLKNISTCSLVVGCFFICSLPGIIYTIWIFISKVESNDRQNIIFNIWASTIFSMNSTFNCLIFFWRNSILRREGMKIVKCLHVDWTMV